MLTRLVLSSWTLKENCNAKQVDFIWKSVQNAGERYVYHWNRSRRSRVIKLWSRVRESPNGNLLTSGIFGNLRKYEACFTKVTSHLTSPNFQTLKIEMFSKPCKIWTSDLRKWQKSQVTHVTKTIWQYLLPWQHNQLNNRNDKLLVTYDQ